MGTGTKSPAIGVISGLALLLSLACFACLEPALNNGDYWRVIGSMGLSIPVNTAPDMAVPFDADQPLLRPESPLAILGWLLSMGLRALGQDMFSLTLWFGILSALYWIGAIACIVTLRPRAVPVAFALFALAYALVSGFFLTFYEEAFTFAILPLLLASAHPRYFRMWSFTLCALLALTSKAQGLFLLPILVHFAFRGDGARPVGRLARAGFLAVMTFGTAVVLYSSQPMANAYNRLFNGIGWASMQVEHWPAATFNDRLAYFDANRAALRPQQDIACLPYASEFMGTTFWPTGYAQLDTRDSDPAAAPRAEMIDGLGLPEFAACFAEVTSLTEYAGSVLSVFLRSDYALDYIALGGPDPEGGAWQGVSVLMQSLAPVLSIGLLVLCLMSRRPWPVLIAVYSLAAAPLFVVLGDGFYEFEKHMVFHMAGLLIPAWELLHSRARPPLAPRRDGWSPVARDLV